MTRPSLDIINSGTQAWDGEVNDNYAKIVSQPFPGALFASLAILNSAHDPTLFDACTATVWNGTPGSAVDIYMSNGTSWVLKTQPATASVSQAKHKLWVRAIHQTVVARAPTEEPPGINFPIVSVAEIPIPSDIHTIVIWTGQGEWTHTSGGLVDPIFSADAPYNKNLSAFPGNNQATLKQTSRKIVFFRHPDDGVWYTQSVTNKGTLVVLSNPSYVLPTYNVAVFSDAEAGWYTRQVDALEDQRFYFNNAKDTLVSRNEVGDLSGYVDMYDYILPEIK